MLKKLFCNHNYVYPKGFEESHFELFQMIPKECTKCGKHTWIINPAIGQKESKYN